MNKSIWRRAGRICGLCCSLALISCAFAPDQRHYVDGVVMVAPPTPQQEVIGEPPVAGNIWMAGYWNWTGTRYQWIVGHWSAPRPGRHWVPDQWVRQGDGWRMKRGHWERD